MRRRSPESVRKRGNHEAVAAPRNRLQNGVTVIIQSTSNFVDALHQAVVGHGGSVPNRLHKFILGHKAVGILDQIAECGKSLCSQENLPAVAVRKTSSRRSARTPLIMIVDPDNSSISFHGCGS